MLRYSPDDRVDLTTTTLVQPRFDRFDDFRILNVSAVEFSIREHLTASILLDLRYDSIPPTDVEKLDVELVNALGAKF